MVMLGRLANQTQASIIQDETKRMKTTDSVGLAPARKVPADITAGALDAQPLAVLSY